MNDELARLIYLQTLWMILNKIDTGKRDSQLDNMCKWLLLKRHPSESIPWTWQDVSEWVSSLRDIRTVLNARGRDSKT